MKTRIFIITIMVMMLSAVQGYAQRVERGARSTRTERRASVRSTRSMPQRQRVSAPQRTTTRTTISRTTTINRSGARTSLPQRREGVVNRSAERTVRTTTTTTQRGARTSTGWRYERVSEVPTRTNVQRGVRTGVVSNRINSAPRRHVAPPSPHRPWRPIFHHHRHYLHHHYNCIFSDWYWYRWGGYHNRFICHRLYHDRFFDSLLGYYIWGALDAPTRLDIGNMTLTRYNRQLKVKINGNVSYLDLYRHQTVIYRSGYTSIEVTTGNGSALVRFYDEYGNEATYRL